MCVVASGLGPLGGLLVGGRLSPRAPLIGLDTGGLIRSRPVGGLLLGGCIRSRAGTRPLFG